MKEGGGARETPVRAGEVREARGMRRTRDSHMKGRTRTGTRIELLYSRIARSR